MTLTEEERAGLDDLDDLARFVGRFLVARGLAGTWADLYADLARGEAPGIALGPDDPAEGPLPEDAALRFLEEED